MFESLSDMLFPILITLVSLISFSFLYHKKKGLPFLTGKRSKKSRSHEEKSSSSSHNKKSSSLSSSSNGKYDEF